MLQFGCMRYLRHAREKKQLSQDRLAELSGVPQNTISRIERGRRLKPHKSTLEKLARVLDVDQPAMLAMDLEEVFEAAKEEATKEDSRGYSLRLAQLESAFLLGYARATKDAAQLAHDG